MNNLSPLQAARKRLEENVLNSCLECKKCVKVGGWWYCEDSEKLLHPMMLERVSPLRCERAVRKEK